MKSPSILLRVLLSAALIFNGISSAVASAQMVTAVKVAEVGASGLMHHDSAAAVRTHSAHHVAADTKVSSGACHDDTNGAPGDAAGTGAGHGKHGTDCCQAGMCSCHCMQQTQVTFAPPVLASPQVAHSASVRAMSSAHESPRLPHLIRPPIYPAS